MIRKWHQTLIALCLSSLLLGGCSSNYKSLPVSYKNEKIPAYVAYGQPKGIDVAFRELDGSKYSSQSSALENFVVGMTESSINNHSRTNTGELFQAAQIGLLNYDFNSHVRAPTYKVLENSKWIKIDKFEDNYFSPLSNDIYRNRYAVLGYKNIVSTQYAYAMQGPTVFTNSLKFSIVKDEDLDNPFYKVVLTESYKLPNGGIKETTQLGWKEHNEKLIHDAITVTTQRLNAQLKYLLEDPTNVNRLKELDAATQNTPKMAKQN